MKPCPILRRNATRSAPNASSSALPYPYAAYTKEDAKGGHDGALPYHMRTIREEKLVRRWEGILPLSIYGHAAHVWATPFCFPFGLFYVAASPKRETFAFSMILGKLILNFI